MRRALAGQVEEMLEGLRDEGFVKPHIRIEPEALYDYLAPFLEPAAVDRFHFNRPWMREQFARINDPRRPGYTVGLKLNLPPSYLLIHRVWIGGHGVCCRSSTARRRSAPSSIAGCPASPPPHPDPLRPCHHHAGSRRASIARRYSRAHRSQ